VTFPGNIPGIPFHHWAAGVRARDLDRPQGGRRRGQGSRGLGPRLHDPSGPGREAKATFKKETAGFQYKSFLPPDQKPPIHLNKELMERYRPALSKHYLKEKPRFE
jgi:aminobenzoyl-glutamate utilization protein B